MKLTAAFALFAFCSAYPAFGDGIALPRPNAPASPPQCPSGSCPRRHPPDQDPANASCMAALTKHGIFTADHCPHHGFDLSFPALDLAWQHPEAAPADADLPDVSTDKPAFYFDRRDYPHKLQVVKNDGHQWLVDTPFFPGESGSPVLDRRGNVCGVVLGNRVGPDATYGRVASFGALSKLISGRVRVRRSGVRSLTRLRAAFGSTPAPPVSD